MITIYTPGVQSIKNREIKAGMDEYAKRLTKFCKIKRAKNMKCDVKADTASLIFEIGSACKSGGTVGGDDMSSEEFASCISQLMLKGYSRLRVDVSLNGEDSARCTDCGRQCVSSEKCVKIRLCTGIGNVELAWLLAYEQIYRAFTIINNIRYHK